METCPTCGTKCTYPHGSDQESFMKPLMPEGTTFHRCMMGHDWLSDSMTGENLVQKEPTTSDNDIIQSAFDHAVEIEELKAGLKTINEIRASSHKRAERKETSQREYLTDEPTPRAITLTDEELPPKE